MQSPSAFSAVSCQIPHRKERDCDNLRDYLDQAFVTTAIMQEEVYQQGFLDCIRLLRSLGV